MLGVSWKKGNPRLRDRERPPVPEPEGADEKEVYAFFGLCSYYGQVLERGVINLAVVLQARGLTQVTGDDVVRAFSELENRTLGQLVRDVRCQIALSEDLEAALKDAVRDRNYLAHRFFANHDVDFCTSRGRHAMIAELRDLTARCPSGSAWASASGCLHKRLMRWSGKLVNGRTPANSSMQRTALRAAADAGRFGGADRGRCRDFEDHGPCMLRREINGRHSRYRPASSVAGQTMIGPAPSGPSKDVAAAAKKDADHACGSVVRATRLRSCESQCFRLLAFGAARLIASQIHYLAPLPR
jgi:hypothetical protein